MKLTDLLQRAWQRRGLPAGLLLPLGAAFALLAATRRAMYRHGLLRRERLSVPVVVIGNITVGGSGKTPLTLWLIGELRERGFRPGVVSRGHGGIGRVTEVLPGGDAAQVGDEPLMMKRRAGLPVFVGRDRVAAARALIAAHPDCDLIVADDGLQHYRLVRDIEIAVVDGRGLLNGWPLPAGPLREPSSRLGRVDALVVNGFPPELPSDTAGPAQFRMRLVGDTFHSLAEPERTCVAADLAGLRLAAIAGIGDPGRFFEHLDALGLSCRFHAFPDHHRYLSADLAAIDADALLMTEKDAVKCAGLTERPVWVLPVTARVEPDLAALVMEKLDGRPPA